MLDGRQLYDRLKNVTSFLYLERVEKSKRCSGNHSKYFKCSQGIGLEKSYSSRFETRKYYVSKIRV